MRKLFLLLLPVLLFLAGCRNGNASSESLPVSEPERVAVLFSSLAEIWLEAGGEIAVTVGETVERGFAPPGTPLVDEGAGKTVNLELLISLEPDFVICSADIPAQVQAAEVLEKAGIPAMLCRVESFADYLTVLSDMAVITGQPEKAEACSVMAAEAAEILASVRSEETKRILFIRAGSTDASTKAKRAEDHFACAMLEEFGCWNIAADTPELLDGLSMETILLADPDYIFFSLMGKEETALAHVQSLLAGDTWGRLSAVREGRVAILPKELFHYKPCSRWPEAYRYLADILSADGEA
ncbi:MAG: ABC transporter substrate-binding protein [Clostridia bacterium]|nr:ABC transporter substrate-binding protein [Clostridia bacterium]